MHLLLAENLHLSEQIEECRQELGIDIHDLCLNPHFTAIEDELNTFFNCFHERLQSMNFNEFSYLFETGNFKDELSLLCQYAENEQYDEMFRVYERIAPIIHCDWDTSTHFTYNGTNYNIPIREIEMHQVNMEQNMMGLYNNYPVLQSCGEEKIKKVLQTAFLTFVLYYNKGINITLQMPLWTGNPEELEICLEEAGAGLLRDRMWAETIYTAKNWFCYGFVFTGSAPFKCLASSMKDYAGLLIDASDTFDRAEAKCKLLYGR